jgi:N-acyl homoserine lactone hydrolase
VRRLTVAALPEVVPLFLGEFRFPEPELADRRGVVMGYAVRHRGGVVLFDTGLGFGNAELEERYRTTQRRIADALADAGLALDDVTAVVNCHLHADHAGQNSAFPGVPIHVQPAEWEIAHTTEHTILDWIDFPGSRYERIGGDHEVVDGVRVVATPGHTPGHQSLAVDTPGGLTILVGQAIYTVEEWVGEPDILEGRSGAPDRDAYDRSHGRLQALEPARVHFGHDRRAWTRTAAD